MKPLWTPSEKRISQTNLTDFMQAVEDSCGEHYSSYEELHRWSVTDPEAFWAFYAAYAQFRFRQGSRRIMSDDAMPKTRWFEGATLNYAEHLLFPQGLSEAEQPALICVTESGVTEELSYADLQKAVAHCIAAMRREGIQAGDRVAAFATNTPETVIVFLACASIGAIFSSCSPDFGQDAALSRFAQIEPLLLFASPLYCYGGKRFDTRATIAALSSSISSLRRVIMLPYPGEAAGVETDFSNWHDWLVQQDTALDFAALPFDHPLYILFSSGTTGLPKAIVHRAGGVLLKHHCEQRLNCDIKAGERVLYFTTCGWMMWNWLMSALAQAATVVQYEGSPGHPDMAVLWKLVERHSIGFFGTSARYLHGLQAQGVSPQTEADLSSLCTIASTGSPLSPAGFEYVYQHIKKDVHLASIAGGTDIVSCFMLGVPTKAVYAGQIQGPALGVDLAAFSPEGKPVVGQPGELVCRQPLPSMPLKFWNDPDYERYQDAYFDTYPGVWRHGDLIEISEQGGIIVYGRSDATLNPGGVRIGTAEVYRPLESIPEVVEACAVGKKDQADEEVWLFVVLQEGLELTEDLIALIRRQIRQQASPRHVPVRVMQVSQLPRTRSGKAMEIAVSRLVNGLDVPNLEVVANPESLQEIMSAIS